MGMTDNQFKAFVEMYLNNLKELDELHKEKNEEKYEKKLQKMLKELQNALER